MFDLNPPAFFCSHWRALTAMRAPQPPPPAHHGRCSVQGLGGGGGRGGQGLRHSVFFFLHAVAAAESGDEGRRRDTPTVPRPLPSIAVSAAANGEGVVHRRVLSPAVVASSAPQIQHGKLVLEASHATLHPPHPPSPPPRLHGSRLGTLRAV